MQALNPENRKKPGRRPSLSKEAILDSALTIANDSGLDGLTIRRLAQQLGVAPMAIYRYYANKEELLNAMFDYVSSLPNFDACANDDWKQELRDSFNAIRKNLVAHPGILPLLTQRYGVGELTNRSSESLLQSVRRSGQSDEVRARSNFALISYTLGFAVLESAIRHQRELAGIEDEQEWQAMGVARMANLPAAEFPERAGLAPYTAGIVSDEQFIFGLDQLLEKLDGERAKT